MSMGAYHLNPYLAFAAVICISTAGCTSPAQAVASQREHPSQHNEQAPVACPSKDFTTFLQRYADVANDEVRLRFTDDPLEYEVPTHTVEEATASSPITHISKHTGPSRLELFSYRYFKHAKIFDQIAAGEGAPEPMSKVGSKLSVELTANEGRRVNFGMEYEVDTYVFEKREGCWHLTRAINLRD
ncbi:MULTISPECIES: hypothetical protein [Xanthomonas]|uniref:Lipoprotein n=1 Tax=Xanthomonas campestris pv. papavericola TaxID=487881 RepID=A0AAJ2X1S4_XANCA|nr:MULTISPECIES: hypothetical protein [Xanthomonas]MEC3887621.1 hypothetical protein [Xanthomonas campestris pv. papavericola]